MFGTLIHWGIDAALLSAFLAGVRRTTGLTPKLSDVPNKDVRQVLRSYLEFGEYLFDFAVVFFGVRCCNARPVSLFTYSCPQRSSSFERRS
ncbi:DUF1748-domain-containing protein [Trametes elegans]|nr:DUF1748-domain-containing protein [Trametes elegans]